MIGNRAEAEDVAQEVFITVFKTIDSFRGESKFSTWLYRVAANHCKNRIKYLARRHDRDRASSTRPSRATPRPRHRRAAARRPDRQLEGAQMERLMQQAIATSTRSTALVIVLRDVEELSYEEIGEITGLPEGTVKSRLHRARLALRKKLQRHVE